MFHVELREPGAGVLLRASHFSSCVAGTLRSGPRRWLSIRAVTRSEGHPARDAPQQSTNHPKPLARRTAATKHEAPQTTKHEAQPSTTHQAPPRTKHTARSADWLALSPFL